MINKTPQFYFSLRNDLTDLCKNTKIIPEDFIPKRVDPEATGYDVRCAVPGGIIIKPGCYTKIPLGFRMYGAPGWWLSLAPRSSTFLKKHLHALYGVIDENFENQMQFVSQFIPDACDLLNNTQELFIEFGERIAQVIPVERQTMMTDIVSPETLDAMFEVRNSKRGTGGFGSSGSF